MKSPSKTTLTVALLSTYLAIVTFGALRACGPPLVLPHGSGSPDASNEVSAEAKR